MLEEEDEEEGVAAFTDVGPLVRFPDWRGKICSEDSQSHTCEICHRSVCGRGKFRVGELKTSRSADSGESTRRWSCSF